MSISSVGSTSTSRVSQYPSYETKSGKAKHKHFGKRPSAPKDAAAPSAQPQTTQPSTISITQDSDAQLKQLVAQGNSQALQELNRRQDSAGQTSSTTASANPSVTGSGALINVFA